MIKSNAMIDSLSKELLIACSDIYIERFRGVDLNERRMRDL